MDHATNKFDSDRKWCETCDGYVPYLMSLDTSYCAQCGGEVRLFSRDDWQTIHEKIKARRPGAKRRKKRDSA